MSNPRIAVLTEAALDKLFPGARARGFTDAEMRALLTIMDAIAEAIRDWPSPDGVPSGHLYAHLAGIINLQMFNEVVGKLKSAGLVSERHHVLRWEGR